MEFDNNSKVVDLKRKLRELSLSYQGSKAQCLERLKTHFATPLPPVEAAPSSPLEVGSKEVERAEDEGEIIALKPVSSESSSEDEQFDEINLNKKRIRRNVLWKPGPEATNIPITEAKTFILLDETWKFRKTEVLKDGTKKDKFTCFKSAACKAALYMVYIASAIVTLLRNEYEHTDHIDHIEPMGIDKVF